MKSILLIDCMYDKQLCGTTANSNGNTTQMFLSKVFKTVVGTSK